MYCWIHYKSFGKKNKLWKQHIIMENIMNNDGNNKCIHCASMDVYKKKYDKYICKGCYGSQIRLLEPILDKQMGKNYTRTHRNFVEWCMVSPNHFKKMVGIIKFLDDNTSEYIDSLRCVNIWLDVGLAVHHVEDPLRRHLYLSYNITFRESSIPNCITLGIQQDNNVVCYRMFLGNLPDDPRKICSAMIDHAIPRLDEDFYKKVLKFNKKSIRL